MDSSVLIAAAAGGALASMFFSRAAPGSKGVQAEHETITAEEVYAHTEGKIHPHIYHKNLLADRAGFPSDLMQREQSLNAVAASTRGGKAAFLGSLRALAAERQRVVAGVHKEALRQRDVTKVPNDDSQARVLPGALSDITKNPRRFKPISRYHGEVHVPDPYF